MSIKAKRILKKIISWAGLFFFILAAGMLYWQLRKHSLMDIARALYHIPLHNLIYACIACLCGYIALSFYDFLALRYVKKTVSWWKWMLAGIISFAVSNNAGHAVVSGGAIRYRLYTRWRIQAGDIVKMLAFSGFTYFLGCAAIVILGYFLVPHNIFEQSVSAKVGINGLFIFCTAALGAYFALSVFFRNKNIRIGNTKFQVPNTETAAVQTFLGAADSILAGLVLYFCLEPFINIPFSTYIGLFVIAQTAGVFSQVPGGIGVFETVFMFALPESTDPAKIFGALLAYRIIYYVLPLIGAGGLFFIYERWMRNRMKRWLEEAKALKEKLPKFIKAQKKIQQ